MPSYLKKMAWKTITMTNLSHPAPRFSMADAEKLGEQLFNVTGTAAPLDGERDRNYRLQTGTGAGWILKVVNSTEPRVESEFQAPFSATSPATALNSPCLHSRKA